MAKPLVAVAICAAVAAAAGYVGFFFGTVAVTAEEKVIPDMRSVFVFGDAPRRYATFKGTWELEGPDKAAFPKQVVSYACDEGDAFCVASEATVYKDSLSLQSSKVSATWSADQVTLEAADMADCRRNEIVAHFRTEEVISITRNGAGTGCTLPPLTADRRARLIDGFKRHFERE